MARLRSMALMMVILALCGVLIATVLQAELLTKRLAQGSLSMLAAIYAFVLFRTTGTIKRDAPVLIASVSVPCVVVVIVANLAFGLLSAVCVPIAIGLLLFSSAAPRGIAVMSLTTITAGYAACAVAVQVGWYPVAPLLPVQLSEPLHWYILVLVVELFYVGAFLAGRAIGANQTRVVEELEQAVRQSSMREALLREARDALQNVAGIGAPGRFTDQELEGFRLGVVIGRGGMGEVYEAERLADGEPAAIKLLRLDSLSDRDALSRFERETRIIAAIRAPNVVRVLGASGPDSIFPYIAMERLRGQDLSSRLRDRGHMPLAEVAELVTQVALGLTAAHTLKVIHRDLKPNNIFGVAGGSTTVWKILDFGVSKWMESDDPTLTAGDIVGTPPYMAPEQARCDGNLDQRVDVYALSAIAFRALTGEPPFSGKMPSVLKCIAEDMPRPPSSYVPLPVEVDHVLAIGLAKHPGDRFQHAIELASAFNLAARGELGADLAVHANRLLAARPYAVAGRLA